MGVPTPATIFVLFAQKEVSNVLMWITCLFMIVVYYVASIEPYA